MADEKPLKIRASLLATCQGARADRNHQWEDGSCNKKKGGGAMIKYAIAAYDWKAVRKRKPSWSWLIIILEASAAAEQIEKDSVIIEKEKAREEKQIDVVFWVWVKYHKSACSRTKPSQKAAFLSLASRVSPPKVSVWAGRCWRSTASCIACTRVCS